MQYVRYGWETALEHLVDDSSWSIPNLLVWATVTVLFTLLKGVAWLADVDKCVIVNNYLLSTNLYPVDSTDVVSDLNPGPIM